MIQYKKVFKCCLLLVLFWTNTNAQEILTLENAVKIALENNYEIKIASNNSLINTTNVALGNAGMLPVVSATVVTNNRIQNSSQTLQNGVVNSLDNAKNNSLNYGVNLDWTVFDGFKMFAKLKQLKELQKLGDSQLKQTILTKISAVTTTYFDLVQQQQQLKALDSTFELSNQRVALAQNRFTIGKASKLEVLNAQVDLNTDKVSILRQKELYANTKIQFNQILARATSTDFIVIDKIKVDSALLLNDLTALAEKQNPQLVAQIISNKVAELQLKQVKGNRYPNIRITTGYNLLETQASLGFATATSARGFNYGFSAALNLFDGFAQNRNEKIAQLQIDNTKLVLEQQKLALQSQLATSYQTYLTNLELIGLEEKNEAIAKQNLVITLDKFKIGTITTLEFRAAQLNYVNAKLRNSNAQFQAKLSEIAIKELAGIINLN
jgi:outer membrane protein TolC